MARDLKLSNVKGILILLVVFGHLIEVYKESYYGVYLFIYSVHMPLFIFISGYFAKRANLKKVVNFVLLYLIFETAYEGLLSIATGSMLIDYTVPYFQLWYLMSMIFWYLIAIPLTKINLNSMSKLLIVLLALVISVSSRFLVLDGFNEYFLSFQRTLSFMFFFFSGFVLAETGMKRLTALLRNRILGFAGFIIAGCVIVFGNKHNLEMVFRGAFNIEDFVGPSPLYLWSILAGMAASVLMCILLLNITGSKKSILTKWGDNSLYIFIFHAFFLIPLQYRPDLLSAVNPIVLFIVLLVAAVGIVMILNSQWFIRLAAPISQPYKYIGQTLARVR